jgi:AcrR family transcriptional regulator/DNA-binding MarR family transcriptional regulator
MGAAHRAAAARTRGWDCAPEGSSARVQVAGIQRTRLLAAAASVVDDLGYTDATVAHITARARISRRTFYELFDNREDCLAALFEDAIERVRGEITVADLEGLPWRERVRGGLAAILAVFDREPVLARVCMVQSARGEETMLERRATLLAQLARVIDEGRAESARGADTPALTAEGLVGAAHAIVYERVLRRSPEPLLTLLPALMSMIALPYLGSAAARREQARPLPPTVPPERDKIRDLAVPDERDPLRGVNMRLTYRTIRVLHAIAERPGISNRAVGNEAGVTDQGQISKLLARLDRLGLIANTGAGQVKGEPNAWRLTTTGERIAQSIQLPPVDQVQVA